MGSKYFGEESLWPDVTSTSVARAYSQGWAPQSQLPQMDAMQCNAMLDATQCTAMLFFSTMHTTCQYRRAVLKLLSIALFCTVHSFQLTFHCTALSGQGPLSEGDPYYYPRLSQLLDFFLWQNHHQNFKNKLSSFEAKLVSRLWPTNPSTDISVLSVELLVKLKHANGIFGTISKTRVLSSKLE